MERKAWVVAVVGLLLLFEHTIQLFTLLKIKIRVVELVEPYSLIVDKFAVSLLRPSLKIQITELKGSAII